jgi:hypothetical protein
MSSGSKKRNPDMNFLFFSKVPVNEPPPGSPTGLLWRQLPVYRAFFYISLKFIIKFPQIKKIFSLFSKALGKDRPSLFPKNGAPMETGAHFQSLRISFGVPVKEAFLLVPLIELPRRGMPHSRALLHSRFKVPGVRAHFQVPQQGPYGERCPSLEPSFTHPPGSPVKTPLQVPVTELPQRETLHF